MKKFKVAIITFCLILCCIAAGTSASAKTVKPKKGFYVCKTATNCLRLSVDKVSGSKITFELAYCGMYEDFSEKVTVKLKNGKANFSVKSKYMNSASATGTIKIVNSKKIKIKCKGSSLFATGKWKTYSFVNSKANISQAY